MAMTNLQKRLDAAHELEKYTGGSRAKRPQEVSLVEDGVLDLKRVRHVNAPSLPSMTFAMF
jgi:hypothetical protein